jgi:DNA-binding transcriptional regulator YhcF (GntR family)
MQLWFARGSEVSIREQLVTQVILGILSDDLSPGQRLPSTRELARRFHVHPNTISAGYRQLEKDNWVQFRHGSGVYVRASKPEVASSPALALDQMIARLFLAARKLGVTLPEVRSRLRHWLELQPPDHFLLIEPDEELRRILAAEMARAITLPVESCHPEECPRSPQGGMPVLLPNREAKARERLAPGTEMLILHIRSVPASLSGYLPAPFGALIGVASRWQEFLKIEPPAGRIFRD